MGKFTKIGAEISPIQNRTPDIEIGKIEDIGIMKIFEFGEIRKNLRRNFSNS